MFFSYCTLFPRVLPVLTEKDFSLLGLGDIVIPGLFVALLLRLDSGCIAKVDPKDAENKSFPKPYFNANIISYALGLVLTVFVMYDPFNYKEQVWPVVGSIEQHMSGGCESLKGVIKFQNFTVLGKTISDFSTKDCTNIKFHIFGHAQPALLYLVPACLLGSFFVGLVRKEFTTVLLPYDEDQKKVTKTEGDKKSQ